MGGQREFSPREQVIAPASRRARALGGVKRTAAAELAQA